MKNLWQKEHFNLLKNTSAQIYMAKCVNINISNKLCTLVYNKYWSIDIFLIILINTCRYAWIFFAKKILYLWNNPKCGLIKKMREKNNNSFEYFIHVGVTNMWQVTPDIWHLTCDTWHRTPETWHLTHETWHMTPDMWQLMKNSIYLYFLLFNFSINAIIRTCWKIQCPCMQKFW